MRASLLYKLIFILLLLKGQIGSAQIRFSASATPSQVYKDEYIQLRFMLENAKEVRQISTPQLANFIVVSGPNQENGMSIINGDVKKYSAISYVIKPKHPGTFVIPTIIAIADGNSYKSNPVNIKVTNLTSGNTSGSNSYNSPLSGINPFDDPPVQSSYKEYILRNGENALDKIKRNMQVRVEADKNTCYVGEPIVATYKLYTRLRSESGISKNPSFNGFSVIDLQQPDNINYKIEKLEGREYNRYIIRRSQLYPLQSGNLTLDVAEIENDVHFIKEDYYKLHYDMFGDMFRDFANSPNQADGMEEHKVILQNKPMTILVKPLPETNVPVSFKGAVGNFSIAINLTKNKLSMDDVGELSLVISGQGNMQLITAPDIAWPESLEGFEPKIKDELDMTTVPVSGKKIITYPFTATKAGTFTLPAVLFSFFDPKTAKYKTVSTSDLELTVVQGTGKTKISTAENNTANKPFMDRLFSNRWLVICLLALIIICGIFIWLRNDYRKEKKDKVVAEASTAATIAVEENILKRMQRSEDVLKAVIPYLDNADRKGFYNSLNHAFHDYLSVNMNIPVAELNKKLISEKLDARAVKNEIVLQIQQLIDEIEWGLYTPFSVNVEMQEMYDRASGLIQVLNTYYS